MPAPGHPLGCPCCDGKVLGIGPWANDHKYTTPVGSFTTKYDNLHVHTYPKLHSGNIMGSNLSQTDLKTGKKTIVGSYELNIFPKSLLK